jgi:D-alanyl-D-alanine carboxypeptidase
MSTRDKVFAAVTKAMARCMLPAAYLSAPGHARYIACQWALAVRFPKENLAGLHPALLSAFTTARTEAFWRDGQLIGVTSGHRDAADQYRMFVEDQRKPGLPKVLHPQESPHVRGFAVDVRPVEGARWLELNGWRYNLYRTYDNEWWHFEFRVQRPVRLPYPGFRVRHGAELSR